ncbi:50S ribosomal protein L17 [Spongiivirga sp. MCCC 1A20706]|uniref:50S ribosomal protein L17 n=1 Tax=Spongiivirga sp. MCCC 1A20706 TaxID=3160963 RepID=UPI0039775E7A
MRHGKKFNHLGRKTAHRRAMLANMACSLIEHKRINTTVAKAKALKQFVEPLVTKSKEDTTHNRRVVFSYLRQKEAVSELFREVATKVGDRPGGYTRIIKMGNRLGDNADMAMIELVDFNETYTAGTPAKKKSRRSRSKKKADAPAAAPAVEETVEEVKAEVEETATEAKAEAVEETTADEAPAEEPKADDNAEETKE